MNAFAVLHYGDINLALNKPASQCSTYSTDVANRATDGRYDTRSCTLYGSHVHPWLSVDLGAAYDVGRVIVTNEPDEAYRNYR